MAKVSRLTMTGRGRIVVHAVLTADEMRQGVVAPGDEVTLTILKRSDASVPTDGDDDLDAADWAEVQAERRASERRVRVSGANMKYGIRPPHEPKKPRK